MIQLADFNIMPYKVGPLLYCPGNNKTIKDKLINKTYKDLTSLCFCLEDSISDDGLLEAEDILLETLKGLDKEHLSKEDLPLLFIRIRTPEHLIKILNKYHSHLSLITGFVLPKFDLSNGREFMQILEKEAENNQFFYAMPTLESSSVASLESRRENLYRIKGILDEFNKYIINVRVGGNDFSQLFGIRRSIKQNIYQIGVIANIFIDIINVLSNDYVVAGPVWEYFGGNDSSNEWKDGLVKEIELDKLNGFIGKTAIHPTQLEVIVDSMKVSRKDYDDALAILNWDSKKLGVSKGNSNRMNEVKTHNRWATKIYILGNIYGIKED